MKPLKSGGICQKENRGTRENVISMRANSETQSSRDTKIGRSFKVQIFMVSALIQYVYNQDETDQNADKKESIGAKAAIILQIAYTQG